MITRAQAEALLTLAESLEACERAGIELMHDDAGIIANTSAMFEVIGCGLDGQTYRDFVTKMLPKKEI